MQDSSKQTKEQEENSQTAGEMSRRKALGKLGKLAVYTTPLMTTLIISTKAEAQFSDPPPPPANTPFSPLPMIRPPEKK